MTEPTLNNLGTPLAGNTPGVNSGNHTPGVKEAVAPGAPSNPSRRGWLIATLVLIIAAIAVGVWWLNRDQAIPTVVLGDQPVVLDLQGLDEPQAINGECIQSFVVNGIGTDAAKQQRYALSVTLVSNPSDEAALAELMGTDACAAELKLVGEAITQRLGLKTAQQDLFTTSYRTHAGRRLFLP